MKHAIVLLSLTFACADVDYGSTTQQSATSTETYGETVTETETNTETEQQPPPNPCANQPDNTPVRCGMGLTADNNLGSAVVRCKNGQPDVADVCLPGFSCQVGNNGPACYPAQCIPGLTPARCERDWTGENVVFYCSTDSKMHNIACGRQQVCDASRYNGTDPTSACVDPPGCQVGGAPTSFCRDLSTQLTCNPATGKWVPTVCDQFPQPANGRCQPDLRSCYAPPGANAPCGWPFATCQSASAIGWCNGFNWIVTACQQGSVCDYDRNLQPWCRPTKVDPPDPNAIL